MLRKLVGVAPRWLAPDGHVLAEADERQLDAALAAVHAAGLAVDHHLDVELGTLVVIGRNQRE
jgi:release factor glutamine methyltransferase